MLSRIHRRFVLGPITQDDTADAAHRITDRTLEVNLKEIARVKKAHPHHALFVSLMVESKREAWHDIIREQLVSLVRRPGMRLPEDTRTLDLVEEAIHHALEAGRVEEGAGLYNDVLGGLRHLGWKRSRHACSFCGIEQAEFINEHVHRPEVDSDVMEGQ